MASLPASAENAGLDEKFRTFSLYLEEDDNKEIFHMKCDSCKENIKENEERELHGQMLCEDCYMDRLSPAKACDPWAVFSAKSFSKEDGVAPDLTENQANILALLEENGGSDTETISEQLQIKPADLEREIATLRHMEKVRGELRAGKKIIRLW